MTIKEALQKYPETETELLLGHVLKQSKEFLYLHPEKKLASAQSRTLSQLVSRYRKGFPLAYLLGYKDFYGYRFKVSKDTLIPRPESEWLVERAVEILGNRRVMNVLDVGTGSGCLAISIAKHAGTRASMHAVDTSESALKIAKLNATQLRAHVAFKKQDLLKGDKKIYDLIIANLPYVPASQYREFYKGLKHEPKSALVDKHGDFKLYEKLFEQLPTNTHGGSQVLMEIDPTMKPLITMWFKHHMPQVRASFTKDIHKLWRFCELNGF